MNNAIDSLPHNIPGRITCSYRNSTASLQVIRITNIANWYFERIIFPGQQLVFQAFPDALLEIHSCETVTTILADRIPCQRLRQTEYLAFSPDRSKQKLTQQ